ncbi:flippase [Mucilaginibacter terrae]|uniref:O-antigen/teichoic acid export membrane protein n=1 Tax=Mucilaginibacter terrae TaxID=1955052 RepID=A0ABU3GS33_9SPHI|nr:flippase [Mucilaginibacter terrae]MDT3401767.1 O-antigen/teichoic acid export membrane protein [Mucilaginibacter terrae]
MHSEDHNQTKNLFKNILSVGLVQIANYLLPLISIPIIVRIIGPHNFGTINYYVAFTAYFLLFINYGFDYTGTRFLAVDKDNIERRNEHFSKILYAKLFLFLCSALIFFICITFVSKTNDEYRVAVFTFLLAISNVLSPNWFYQGMQDLTKVAIFNLCTKVIYTLAILIIVKHQSDYILQPLALSVTQIIISVISFVLVINKYKIKLQPVKLAAILNLLWIDRLIFFTLLSSNLYTDTNIVILGLYETKENIGYFSAAWKFIFIFLMVISFPISQAFFPYIAESFSKNVTKGIEQVRRVLPMIVYFTILGSVAIYFLADILIISFYGEKFAPAVYVFKVLTLVPVLSYINTMLGLQTMVNLKMDKAYFRIILLGGIFSVVFNLIVIKFYGYKGGAWSWVFTEIVIALIMHFYLKSKGYNLFDIKLYSISNVLEEIKLLVKKFTHKSDSLKKI